MKNISSKSMAGFVLILISFLNSFSQSNKFISIKGQSLIDTKGKVFEIKGTNLGNWLNPEGYMFLFEDKASSYRLINQAFCEMVGEDFTNQFWRKFKENYITREDIFYIKKTGMNTVRIPFHYKLFTDEDYMGLSGNQNGFELLDKVIKWCGEAGIYVILDMHDAPGGQTGDNIDDSYGYPWLFEEPESQQKFIDIWQKIAKRYAGNSTIMGYDLLNEPIAPYHEKNIASLNAALEPLYKECIAAIRKVDKNHIIMLGGAQWNTNFIVFNDWKFDDKLMYTCHIYWCTVEQKSIQAFVDFKEKTNLPMYMGETGENTDQWVSEFTDLLNKNKIGWTYWPYKKMVPKSGMMRIAKPEGWDEIIEYTKKDRSSFAKIREARPNQVLVRKAMTQLLDNMKFNNCEVDTGYIKALGMKP